MENKGYIVAIDLGSSDVAMGVAEKSSGGIRLAALVSVPCEGVSAGQIENIKSVSQAIGKAKEEIQQQLGIRITEAYAGISGQFVRCASHKDYVFTADKLNGVSQTDVDRLFDRMRNVQAPNDEVVMERIPQNYVTDNNTEVRNPVGAFCSKLSSTFNFILCTQIPMQRLELALKNCGIVLKRLFPNTMAIPEAVLFPEEKEEGVAVVDIGGGVTDVSVYYRNVLRYVATIPIGGSAINRDIRSQSIPEKYVETLKCRYGSALAELAPDTLVNIKGRTVRESKDIPRRNLATIIEARMHDIVEYVVQELRASGYYEKLAYGMVLSGGTARLQGVDELFRRTTGMEVRIADTMEGFLPAAEELPNGPEFATVGGLLLCGAGAGICMTPELSPEEWYRRREEEERIRREEEERIQREQAERAREEAIRRRKEEEERREAEEKRRKLLEELNKIDGRGNPTVDSEEEARKLREAELAERRAREEAERRAREEEEERKRRESEAKQPVVKPVPEPDSEPEPEPKKPGRISIGSLIQKGIKKANDIFSTATGDDEDEEI